MDELDAIKRSADSWYEHLMSEVDKAVEKAFDDAATPPVQKKENPPA